ncbi:MAG TPA: nitrilase-related carbon-nitrogen hydrolase [Tissierellaceae bacterium]|nr:nitrilase-related carbon-nitrogen hydrolase [Tissierellaceae bacterium]
MKERKMKIAIGQFEQIHGNTEANTEKMLDMIENAAKENADIIIFPELAYSGYNLESEELQKLAEPVDGPFVQLLRNKAKELRIHIMAGYPEADKVIPGRMYNSLVFIDDEGKVLDNMRKVFAWGQEKLKFREGKRLPVVDTKFGKIGMLICYDMEHPEPARIEALKGAEIIFNASFWSAIPAERRWHVDLAGNALFNLLYMVGANAVGDNLCGSSMIVGPDGEVVKQASREEEELLVAEIDLNRVLELRSKIPYLNDFKDELFSMDAVEKY